MWWVHGCLVGALQQPLGHVSTHVALCTVQCACLLVGPASECQRSDRQRTFFVIHLHVYWMNHKRPYNGEGVTQNMCF